MKENDDTIVIYTADFSQEHEAKLIEDIKNATIKKLNSRICSLEETKNNIYFAGLDFEGVFDYD